MTNRTTANNLSKSEKPTALKRGSGATSAYFGDVKKDDGTSKKPIQRKRDADSPLNDTAVEDKEFDKAAEKRLALNSLKDDAREVFKAIDYEAGAKPSADPFQNITQSPAKPEALDTEHSAPTKYITLNLEPFANTNAVSKSSSYQYSTEPHDIDKRDAKDELCVAAYVQDMMAHWRDNEQRACVEPDYMIFQKEINPKMRAILIDWMALVCTKSKVQPEVIYLAVNILDRYLALKQTTKRELQLVGTAALFIASKYEEVYCVAVDDLVYLCDGAYSIIEIYEMETRILKALNYQISLPTVWHFLLRFLNAAHADKKMVYMSQYILELSLLNIHFIDYLPSELAAAAIMIARKAHHRNPWSPTLRVFAGYVEEEIRPVAHAMLKYLKKVPADLIATKKNFSSERKCRVAEIPLPKL